MSETVPVPREGRLPSFDAPADAPHSWLRDMAATIRDQTLIHGAVLVHGVSVDGPEGLAEVRKALGIGSFVPTEAFNQRKDFGDGIVGPIRWPQDRVICPFQENSFSSVFPSTVLTACLTPPEGGGQAHLSDSRRLAGQLPAPLADRIRRGGWTMTRSFHEGFGISWQEAFSVSDRAALDELLEATDITYEWLPNGTLYTVRHRPGVVDHPVTGEECWFNQISFLNAGSLDPTERSIMIDAFGKHIPMDTAFGDGSPLSEEDLTAVQQAYDSVRIDVPWRRGDLLVADNVLMAQGRSSYTGSGEFLIALGAQ